MRRTICGMVGPRVVCDDAGSANDAAPCVAPGWGWEQETAPLEIYDPCI